MQKIIITNTYLHDRYYHTRIEDINLTPKQLIFVNSLDFDKYGSGWKFLNCLFDSYGYFEGALKRLLLKEAYNTKEGSSPVYFLEVVKSIKNNGFMTPEISDLLNDIKISNITLFLYHTNPFSNQFSWWIMNRIFVYAFVRLPIRNKS